MQYPQQRLAECRCVITVRHYAQQHDQQQPELVLEQHQHHKITKLMQHLSASVSAASDVHLSASVPAAQQHLSASVPAASDDPLSASVPAAKLHLSASVSAASDVPLSSLGLCLSDPTVSFSLCHSGS